MSMKTQQVADGYICSEKKGDHGTELCAAITLLRRAKRAPKTPGHST